MHAHVRDIGGAKGMRSGERTAWAGTCQSVSLPAASSAVAVKTVVTGVPGRRSTGLLETATMTLSAAPPRADTDADADADQDTLEWVTARGRVLVRYR